MLIILIVLLVICIHNIKFCYVNRYFDDYMSIEKTTSINGIFVIMVFLRHFSSYVQYVNFIDYPFVIINNGLSQLIVTTFLFYSGYGIMESIKRKDYYVDKIPKYKILKTLIHFDIAIIFFVLINIILNNHYAVKEIILAFFAWNSIGNSCWYIFAVIILYTITFISFKLCKNKYTSSLNIINILSLAYVVIFMYIKNEPSWYNTFFCYVAGMWFSLYKIKIDKFIIYNKKYAYVLFSIIILFIASSILYVLSNKNILFYEIDAILFVLFIVVVTMKVAINNSILNWLGKHVFSIYIIQRIPMIVYDYLKISSYNIYIYFIISFITTILLAYIFEKILKRIDSYIFK